MEKILNIPNTINRFKCASLDGLSAKVIDVEATFTKGLPSFSVVGLASSDIQESKERVKSALLTNGFTFPPLKITVNLSPSDIKKSGTHFDLPLALLVALNQIDLDEDELFVFGELGLDGKIKASSMIFPLILSLKEQKMIQKAIVPLEALEYLRHISDIEFIAVESINQAIELISTQSLHTQSISYEYHAKRIQINQKEYFYTAAYSNDFYDIKGQTIAKRASLIAACGMHNFLMQGSPGCGKSMISKRLNDILPPLSKDEILSIAKHQFLDGTTPDFDPKRPLRSPHHTATSASIFGGGSTNAKIGEVALANHGILFFDELPHFSKNILEALREPLQDRIVNISRVNAKVSYDADLMFVAAMNPCPCGNLLSKVNACRCSEMEIKRYKNRLSDPFLDRIDIFVTMQEISASDSPDISSQTMHQSVLESFERQMQRGQSRLNGKLSEKEIEHFCTLEPLAQETLEAAITRFGLTHRSIASIKKVARTIADLNAHTHISKPDLLEALSYRRR